MGNKAAELLKLQLNNRCQTPTKPLSHANTVPFCFCYLFRAQLFICINCLSCQCALELTEEETG